MEQFLTEKGKNKIYINTRKGFVKLAVEYGASIYPYYAFGENDLYETVNYFYDLREWIVKKFHVCITLGYNKVLGVRVPFPFCPA